ncbi:hypothetical protein DJ90_6486 [Paenibacillus macerans]|uniref:Uncharacterized protein n=1 Tax=Paenibacillus macerans TaxID=44252 RepID=A0A090Y815_PAEMA|nr:hypothetical protein DJ90_6486 [Paenibacillus macerans]
MACDQPAVRDRRNRHTNAQQLLPHCFFLSLQAQPTAPGVFVQIRLQMLQSQGSIRTLQRFPRLSYHFPQGHIQPKGLRERLHRRCMDIHMPANKRD